MKPDSAIEIVQQLRNASHEAYLVGGCVRDMVMGIEPADYDIATSAHPDQIMKMFPRTAAIGAKFGVVLVIHRDHEFEVATFRSDEAYIDGRRPTGVVFTDARTDVLRRDFTINGLLYDPIEKRILDFVHGQDDIANKTVRAIGDPSMRFEEDKLRILRAIRFGARLGYAIEPRTWSAVCAMAPQIHQVSTERIQGEIVRTLTEGQARHGVQLMHASGLLREILPEVEWNSHLMDCLAQLKGGESSAFAMGVLLHEISSDITERILIRLKFSNAEIQHIVSLVRERPRMHGLRELSVGALKKFCRLPRFEDHLELMRICDMASHRDLDDYNFARQAYQGWTEDDILPTPLVTGQDLIELGFTPSPIFKEILNCVEDEQLEGRLRDRTEALEFVTSNYGQRR